MKTIGEKYREIKEMLASTGEAEAEAKHILAHVYGCTLAEVYLRFSYACEKEEEIDAIASRRLTGMPLAYAMREKAFYGYDFYVDERVLIPRSDTECVAEKAIDSINGRKYESVLDLCCGSGCIGIAVGANTNVKRIVFADVSSGALEVARKNAQDIIPGKDCEFIQGDLFENISGRFDLIVCNPPYISPEEYSTLENQVRAFEPQLALVAQKEGYAVYERLAAECGNHLNPGGMAVLETGSTQGDRVAKLMEQAGFIQVQQGFDLASRGRFVSGERGNAASRIEKSRW